MIIHFDALHVIEFRIQLRVAYQKCTQSKTTRNDVIKLTTKNVATKNANVETTNANERVIVKTNDTNTYKTMRENANTRKNVRFDHSKCEHRNDKNDRAKCRKLMQSNATTFVYVVENESNETNDSK